MAESTYPEAFLSRMKNLLGEGFNSFVDSLDTPAPTSIRVNPFKPVNKFDASEPIPWCQNGRYLEERPSFTFDPLFHAGTYYVQEASSMFIEQAWKQINPGSKTVKVLDMCAAPGGKSTHLLSLMNSESLLVSNEIIANRNLVLQENITKWGTANAIVTQNNPEVFSSLQNYFDIVLIDAPCSGEGLFRKDKNAVTEWSEKNVETCSIRQRDILKHAIACLKQGGFLIYSTCTFEDVENDLNIEWAENQFPVKNLKFKVEFDGIAETKYGFQFFPDRIKGEGFYLAVLQKDGESSATRTNPKPQTNKPELSTVASKYLHQSDEFNFTEKKEHIIAIPRHLQQDIQHLSSQLNLRHSGILLGERKGKDFIPAHDLALSTAIKNDLPKVELTGEQAIAYLRCDTIKLATPLRGWCLVTYQGHNLGWVKVMDNRVNNYYPRELRILKQ